MSLDIDLASSNSSSYDECPICLEYLVRSIAKTNCGHQFHFECLSNWIYSQRKIVFTCPSCNTNPCEIINVYSKKKSGGKLNGVDSSTLLEISNLESTDMESNNRENIRENNRNDNMVNNKKANINSSVKVCSLCNIL